MQNLVTVRRFEGEARLDFSATFAAFPSRSLRLKALDRKVRKGIRKDRRVLLESLYSAKLNKGRTAGSPG